MAQLQAATLQQLSMSDLIAKSTSIVRGTVQGSYTAFSGPVIFTHYRVQVVEKWKGASGATVDVAVPGGVVDGIRQTYGGAPQFQPGEQYVLFLWTGKSGMTQIVGFSQGVFAVAQDGSSDPSLTRNPSHELMLDAATHSQVNDQPLTMQLSELRAQVASALGGAR
ncbi:MAG: hypothetical protein ABSE42_19090 [Bryobacteraceae bacterium]|jgi:hypothetical protein